MTGRERMYALWQAVRAVRDVPGDVVECGVWRGGSSILAALALADMEDDRKVWLFDTFAGMPDPGEQDVDLYGAAAAAEWDRHRREDGVYLARAGLEDVTANLAACGVAPDRVELVAGRVEDTIPERAPQQIALLRLDTDWYASTQHELEQLWPRLAVGGVLIVRRLRALAGHAPGRRRVLRRAAGRADAHAGRRHRQDRRQAALKRRPSSQGESCLPQIRPRRR